MHHQAQANTEAALCAWRTEAESHRASLEAAEQRCAEQLRRAQAARRHAAEVVPRCNRTERSGRGVWKEETR